MQTKSLIFRFVAGMCSILLSTQMPACVASDIASGNSSEANSASDEAPAQARGSSANEPHERLNEARARLLASLPDDSKELLEAIWGEAEDRPTDLRAHAKLVDQQVRSGGFGDGQPVSTAAVGSLPGSLAVTDSGAATYGIPLAVPPGRGLTPSLTLAYNSHGRDGALGQGWSISVPPTIHLCDAWSAVPAVRSEAMKNDDVLIPEAKDRLCYGDKPMVAIDHVDYGWRHAIFESTPVEFRLAEDSFTKIVRPGFTGLAPENLPPGHSTDLDPGFKVWRRNGEIDQYRQLISSHGAAYWVVSYTEDRWGNRVNYHFDKDSARIESIDYTDGTRRVDFSYDEEHPRARVYRAQVGPVELADLLSTITASVSGEIASEYRLDYEQSDETKRPLLRAVQRCAGDGVCMPATTFEYSDREGSAIWVENSGSDVHLDGLPSEVHVGQDPNPFTWPTATAVSNVMVLDLNGDGVDDVVWHDSDEEDKWRYRLSNPGSSSWWGSERSFPDSQAEGTVLRISGHLGLGEQAFVVHTEDGRLLRYGLPHVSSDDEREMLEPGAKGYWPGTGRTIDINGDGVLDFVGCLKDEEFGYFDDDAFPPELYTNDSGDEFIGRWAAKLGSAGNFALGHTRSSDLFCTPLHLAIEVVRGRLDFTDYQRSASGGLTEWDKSLGGRQMLATHYTAEGGAAAELVHFTTGTAATGPCYLGSAANTCPSDEEIADNPEIFSRWEPRERQPGAVGDFNGDGLRDFLHHDWDQYVENEGKWTIYAQYWPGRPAAFLDEVHGAYQRRVVSGLPVDRRDRLNPERTFDYNEDGISDLIFFRRIAGVDDPKLNLSAGPTTAWRSRWGRSLVIPTGLYEYTLQDISDEDRGVPDIVWAPGRYGDFNVWNHGLDASAPCSSLYDCEEKSTLSGWDTSFAFPDRPTRQITGVQQHYSGDFDGDGRTDMLKLRVRSNTPHYSRVLAEQRRRTASAGRYGRPKLDLLVGVTNGYGVTAEISYLPGTDSRVSPDQRAWNSELGSATNGCIADGTLECASTLVSSTESVVWTTQEGIGLVPENEALRTAYTYEGARVDRVTNKPLGYAKTTRVATRGGELASVEVREFDNARRIDVPVSDDGVEMERSRALLAGKLARRTRVSPREFDVGPVSETITYIAEQTELAYGLLRTVDAGIFEAPHVLMPVAQETRTSEFSLDSDDDTSPSGLVAEASDKSNPNSLWSESRVCDVGEIQEPGELKDIAGLVDSYGNPGCVYEGNSSGYWTKRETSYRHDTDPEAIEEWQIALPTAITTTRGIGGDTQTYVQRVHDIQYCYDTGIDCLVYEGVPAVVFEDTQNNELTLRTQFGYDEFGHVEEVITVTTGELPRYSQTSYDPDDAHVFPLETRQGPLDTGDHVTTFVYDPRFGAVTAQLDPKGLLTTTVHDGFGRAIFVDSDGVPTFFFYSNVLNEDPSASPGLFKMRTWAPGILDETVRYDGAQRPVYRHWHGFNGYDRTVHYEYDKWGYLSGTSLPEWDVPSGGADPARFIRYENNPLGERLSETHANGRVIEYDRHVRNQYSAETVDDDGVVTHTLLDAAKNVVARIDGLGNQRCYEYDANQKLEATWMLEEGAGLDVVAPCAERPIGSPVTRTFHDEKGQPVYLEDPEAGERSYEYNPYGELVRTEYPANHDQPAGTLWEDLLEYDSLGRVKYKLTPDDEVSYTWDTVMPTMLAMVEGNHGVDSFVHDYRGNLQHENHLYADESWQHYAYDYTYDETTGLLSTLTMPEAGPGGPRPRIEYRYDEWGNAIEVLHEDAAGNDLMQLWRLWGVNVYDQPTWEDFADGYSWTQRQYDDRTGNLTDVWTQRINGWNIQTIADMTFVHDRRSQLDIKYDWLMQQGQAYYYDAADRLTWTQTGFLSGGSTRWDYFVYDQLGNMTFRSDVGTLTYSGTPRRLTDIAGVNVEYDARGNQVVRGSNELEYNAHDKPVVIHTDNGVLTVDYDAEGMRVRQEDPGQVRRYAGSLYEKIEEFGETTKHHYRVPVNGQVIAEITYDEDFASYERHYTFATPDDLGSPTIVSDVNSSWGGSPQPRDRFSYGVWGNRRNPQNWQAPDFNNTSLTTLGFTGHAEGYTAGLIYMQARLYDPRSARFISPDPIVGEPFETHGWSRYVYVGNDPANFVDPSGLSRREFFEAIGNAYSWVDPGWSAFLPGGFAWSLAFQIATGDCIEGYNEKNADGSTTIVVGNCGRIRALVDYLETADVSGMNAAATSDDAPSLGSSAMFSAFTSSMGHYATLQRDVDENLNTDTAQRVYAAQNHPAVLGSAYLAVGLLAAAVVGSVALGRTVTLPADVAKSTVGRVGSQFSTSTGGAAQRVLGQVVQTGGKKISQSTANALNKATGSNLTRREWGRAVEALKRDQTLRPDYHGQITEMGNYLSRTGEFLGNLLDYVP